jgi:8-oxo-dGTP pyrophosphatase MutT (NUDIX family)
MKEYVIVHTRKIDEDLPHLGPYEDVLLVHKDRPEWQKGRLNLIGGKLEEGEDAITAAVRELGEESGLERSSVDAEFAGNRSFDASRGDRLGAN